MIGRNQQLPDATDQQPARGARWWWIVAAVLVIVAVAVTASLLHTGTQAAPAAATSPAAGAAIKLAAGSPTCIDAWSGGPVGTYTFDFLNDEGDDLEVYLEDVKTRQVYLEVENFGGGATRQVTALLPPATYRWVCITSYTIKYSKPVVVTGAEPREQVHGVVPVTPLDLRIPINQYVAWVQSQLPTLAKQTQQLQTDLHAGDLAAAKRDWLAGHLTYETLGAAYGAFGAVNDAINADPPAAGAADAKFGGFRKIEAMLWAGRPAAAIAPYGDALVAAVGRLRAELIKPNAITPLAIGVRAHEILEDTLGRDLNGTGDAGSRTDLATVDANLTGTSHALAPLLPLLRKQDPYLTETQQWLTKTQQLVQSYHHRNGWVPLSSLTIAQRAQLNADVQQAVELLSHVAVITEPRNATR
ncbi:EfeM/EfeO family lipoprotein [Kribbella sp.]|uniref:EfeM/EfeO family lipoprotein n=1 Tax=Kribbella sp. TaxID=1871183 RepID=UPI002D268150|nr:EfeM/EfeO family lipoprotein [Kribbella sp.]HZX06218.1 EfeM/EfeO family lipoprotein [Kribbella sp.]